MKDTAKCFLLANGKYIETTYAEIKKRRETDEAFRKRKFILLHGMLLEVTETDYMEFQRTMERQRYIRRRKAAFREASLDYFSDDRSICLEIMADIDVEDHIVDRIMVEKLQECLRLLTAREWEFIQALYFDGKSERQFSQETGIPRKTINDHRRKLLAKLKKWMES